MGGHDVTSPVVSSMREGANNSNFDEVVSQQRDPILLEKMEQ